MAVQQSIDVAKTIQVACTAGTSGWLPIVSTTIGALVGGLASFFGAVGSEKRRSKSKSKSVHAAIVAEVRALLRIIELRGYVSSAKELRDALQREGPGKCATLQVQIDDGYNKVFKANLENIGLLNSEVATQIVEFYQLIQAVVSDVSPGGLIAEGMGGNKAFSEMIAILEEAIVIGVKIITEDSK